MAKIIKDKFGREMKSIAFRCPVEMVELLEREAQKNDTSVSGMILKVLKKAFNFKG